MPENQRFHVAVKFGCSLCDIRGSFVGGPNDEVSYLIPLVVW